MTKDFLNLKSKVKINGCDIQVAVKNEMISIVGHILWIGQTCHNYA